MKPTEPQPDRPSKEGLSTASSPEQEASEKELSPLQQAEVKQRAAFKKTIHKRYPKLASQIDWSKESSAT